MIMNDQPNVADLKSADFHLFTCAYTVRNTGDEQMNKKRCNINGLVT